MASQRIVIDPITRIEGHLRIELETDGGRITNAWACTTQFRGLEKILQGRDPRDAWALAQRICGVCTGVHAIASIRAVEDALKYPVPRTAELIRTLMSDMGTVQDHVIHFYHLHALDWVDVTSALKADPAQTARLARFSCGLAVQFNGPLCGRTKTDQGFDLRRTVEYFYQRLLGSSGLPAAARGQPDGGGALSGGAGMAA